MLMVEVGSLHVLILVGGLGLLLFVCLFVFLGVRVFFFQLFH